MAITIEEEKGRVGRPNTKGCDPTKPVTPKLAAWAAGLLEGKGSFFHSTTGPRLIVQHTNILTLKRLRNIFGGSITPHNNTNRYVLTGNRIFSMLNDIAPFLTSKRLEEIRNVLQSTVQEGK